MKKLYLSLFIISALFFSFLCFAPGVRAAAGDLAGYAWSPNIGWIGMSGVSFNTQNLATNPNKDLIGYAWSPNVGWIAFNAAETVGCPSAPGTGTICKPQIHLLDSGKFTGWARVLSMKTTTNGNYDREINPINNAPEDWTTGWISLSNGSNYNTSCMALSGDLLNPNIPGTCLGYAWGSSKVIGWINFKLVTVEAIPNPGGIELQVNGSAQWTPQNPLSLSVGSNGASFPLRWLATAGVNSNLMYSNTNNDYWCNLYSNEDGQTTLYIPYGVTPSNGFYFKSPKWIPPVQTIISSVPPGMHAYQTVCATTNNGLAYSNVVAVQVGPAVAPTISLASCEHTLSFIGATNLVAGTPCTGNASSYFPSVPFQSNFPQTASVSNNAIYTLNCGTATAQVTIPGPSCGGGPGISPDIHEN